MVKRRSITEAEAARSPQRRRELRLDSQTSGVVAARLENQKLAGRKCRKPEEVVRWLGAVQAQDYPAAKWALSLRSDRVDDEAVEKAIDAGRILRTHVLRPTWHFVAPADIRWMLALTGPRVRASIAYSYRLHELDERTLSRSRTLIERALRGGKHLTRRELGTLLSSEGIQATGQRLAHIVMHAELNGLICSGPRRDRQFTYALLEERVRPVQALDRDEAVKELVARYFISYGPATIRDFVWWSGLTARDATNGIAMNGRLLERVTIDNTTYYGSGQEFGKAALPPVILLPNYDEYVIAYKDRTAVLDSSTNARLAVLREFPHFLVLDGRIRGRWKRTLTNTGVRVEVRPSASLKSHQRDALEAAVRQYGRFLDAEPGLNVVVLS